LLERNPEHPAYYTALTSVLGIPADDEPALKAIYDEYAEKFPRSDAARRLPLDFLTGINLYNTFNYSISLYLPFIR